MGHAEGGGVRERKSTRTRSSSPLKRSVRTFRIPGASGLSRPRARLTARKRENSPCLPSSRLRGGGTVDVDGGGKEGGTRVERNAAATHLARCKSQSTAKMMASHRV